MKRGYFVHGYDESQGIGVIAETAKEAKKLAFGIFDCDWIDLRVRWIPNVEVEKMPIGVVRDGRKGLLCGLYGYIVGYNCDRCGKESTLTLCSCKALCDDCIANIERGKGRKW